jgi:signal transduction histidine kinase
MTESLVSRSSARSWRSLWRWRDNWYLIVSSVTGTFGFVLAVTAVSTTAGTSFALIGIPAAVLVARFDRWWCGFERTRAGRILGREIPDCHREPRGGGRIARALSMLTDRQTWLDVLWMFAAFPLGLVGLLIVSIMWGGALGLLSSPIWLWSIPDWVHRHDVLLSIAFPLLALPAAGIGASLVGGYAVLHARIAEVVLGPRRTEVLQARVRTLAETRAGAVDAAVTELQRVERDLHDGAQARLVALAMDLGMAEQRLANADAESARAHVASARDQARAAMAELRDLVRGIGPSILTDRGLDAALTALVSGRNPPVELAVAVGDRPVGASETAAYFVVAEALANARKHAQASLIRVDVRERPEGRLVVEVVDDGVGGADPGGGSGLAGLRKRVAALDGTLTVTSPAGGPTAVVAELPCGS